MNSLITPGGTYKVLTAEGKQRASMMFMHGAEMADVAARFGVARGQIEQTVREAIQQLARQVVTSKESVIHE